MATAKTKSKPKTKGRQRTDEANLSDNQLTVLLATMLRIRQFEDAAREVFLEGKIRGTAHSSVGQEAIAAGACIALDERDFVVSHHRGHGHCIAKGARTDLMMAELLGREDGYCGGLGGSMHVADLGRNILGANGIVGAGIGIGTGAALSAKIRGDKQVGIAFFGDGAANQGLFHESMNLAALWKLPIIYLCENNHYGLSTPFDMTTAGGDVAGRAKGYGVEGVSIDGNDVMAVYAAVENAVAKARRGDGPTLIEAKTYRWGDHSMRANLPRYRSEEEEEEWFARDPIGRLEKNLRDGKVLSGPRIDDIYAGIEQEITDAVSFSEASAEPDLDSLAGTVYAPSDAIDEEPTELGERELTYADALNEALHQEMARDEAVFVMGEDVARIGGIFGVTKGLLDVYGDTRVRETPISEGAIAAAGVGSAITGMRPVIEVMIFDFITLMMDMIVNQAAKFRFMLGGKPTVPLVIRGPQGGGIGMAAQHSQSLEAWFLHVPGLVVCAPSNPADAKGLLTAAIRDDNPVIFLEHKLLYLGQTAPVPEQPYAIPLGKASIRRHGSDVTVVATMAMVEKALGAARQVERDGLDVEVIDPRTLRPLDTATVIESVKKTNRLIVVHEAWKQGGFGAELSAVVVEEAFDHLDAPVVRLGGLDTPMPYNGQLERQVVPSQDDIAAAIRNICA